MKSGPSQNAERNITTKFTQGKTSHMIMLITDKSCLTAEKYSGSPRKEKKIISVYMCYIFLFLYTPIFKVHKRNNFWNSFKQSELKDRKQICFCQSGIWETFLSKVS